MVLEVGDAVLAGDSDGLELDAEAVGDRLRHVHVVALEAHVGAGRGEGREVGEDADLEGSGGLDVGQRVRLRGGAGDEEEEGRERGPPGG